MHHKACSLQSQAVCVDRVTVISWWVSCQFTGHNRVMLCCSLLCTTCHEKSAIVEALRDVSTRVNAWFVLVYLIVAMCKVSYGIWIAYYLYYTASCTYICCLLQMYMHSWCKICTLHAWPTVTMSCRMTYLLHDGHTQSTRCHFLCLVWKWMLSRKFESVLDALCAIYSWTHAQFWNSES
jgi:hypothetical protein